MWKIWKDWGGLHEDGERLERIVKDHKRLGRNEKDWGEYGRIGVDWKGLGMNGLSIWKYWGELVRIEENWEELKSIWGRIGKDLRELGKIKLDKIRNIIKNYVKEL